MLFPGKWLNGWIPNLNHPGVTVAWTNVQVFIAFVLETYNMCMRKRDSGTDPYLVGTDPAKNYTLGFYGPLPDHADLVISAAFA